MTLGSFFRFGYYFVRQLVLRAVGRAPGLRVFEENYANDRLLPMSTDEREILPSFSRCIACGMCDAAFTGYARVTRSEFRGPSDLPLSYSRNPPDFDGLRKYVRNLKEGDLEALERVCPAKVPFRRLVVFVESQAQRLGTRELPALPSAPRAMGDRRSQNP